MCKVYAYMRVSTKSQVEHGYGLEAQRREIDKYAAANGITIQEYFTDAGISGAAKDTASDDEAIGKRHALLDMLATVEKGDAVIVLNTSRLWRSDNTKVLIRRELMKHGARIISIEQPRYDIYAADPNERLISGLLELLDECERASIALKLARGRRTKAYKGDKPAGACPYGYKYSDDGHSIEISEAEAQIVKKMFSLAQRGASLGEISAALTAEGYTAPRGGEWSRGSLQKILRNRFYIGELQHDGKMIQGNHTPIVSRVTFGKVAAQLDRRHR